MSKINNHIMRLLIPDNLFNEIKIKVAQVKKDKANFFGHELAGNILEEYKMDINFPDLNNFCIDAIKNNEWFMKYVEMKKKSFLKTDENEQYYLDMKLINAWVNFMKKHEFNPIHNHGGMFSFIIFVQIPFVWHELQKVAPGQGSNSKRAGALEFYSVDWEKIVDAQHFKVDKTWEKQMLLFPASLQHAVYPFYGTDKYRITVSGNLAYTNIKKEKYT